MNIAEALWQLAWKGTLILAGGFAAWYLMARASSALRHYLWTTVFAALLILPAAMWFTPKWSLPSAPAPAVHGRVTVETSAAVPVQAPSRPPANPLPWIYCAGLLVVAIRFVGGVLRTRAMMSGSISRTIPGVPPNVRVLESPNAPVPMVWGILRPVIVLPTASRSWSPDRLRTVLLHELMHVERRDLLAQVVAQAACCLYWFHPLAWIAARELRRERERACDDAVLQRGVAAPEYAGHLVDLVRGLTVEAPAMAEASDFEGRVRALLDRNRSRKPLTRGMAMAMTALALALILPVASVTSFAQTGRGALAGVVTDPSGGRVPGAQVLARNLDGANQETTTADAAGEFIFRSIPPGQYELEVRSRGFKILKQNTVVTAGAVGTFAARLQVGETTEAVTVKGTKGTAAPVAPRAVGTPQRIPVGGNVQPLKLLRQTKPEYPEELQRQGITGVVIIRAIVGKEGQLLSPQVVNTEVHPGLAKAALDAVSQWLYDPSKLNGQPVETLTTIDIRFELDPK